jgi:GDP-4-dehydro-6-deoxy-D-mannose reductase
VRTLITGITGFVGFHLTEYLLSAGCQVVGISRSAQWHHRVTGGVRRDAELLAWELPHPVPQAVRRRVEEVRPDVVFHLAGLSIPSLCGATSPTEQALRVNVGGTRAVLDLVASLPWQPRVVLASSNHVYAPVPGDAAIVDEQAPIAPPTGYGITKWQAEQEVRQALRDRGVRAVIVRGFQHAGPYQPPGLMLSDWVEQLARSPADRLVVKSQDSFLDLVDVRDAAAAYVRVFEAGSTGAVYNLGSGQARRSGDVLQMLLDAAGKHPSIQELSPGQRWNPIANSHRLQALGWRPQTPLTRTVADMWQCYLEDPACSP